MSGTGSHATSNEVHHHDDTAVSPYHPLLLNCSCTYLAQCVELQLSELSHGCLQLGANGHVRLVHHQQVPVDAQQEQADTTVSTSFRAQGEVLCSAKKERKKLHQVSY